VILPDRAMALSVYKLELFYQFTLATSTNPRPPNTHTHLDGDAALSFKLHGIHSGTDVIFTSHLHTHTHTHLSLTLQ